MSNDTQLSEQLSALADGELAAHELPALLAALQPGAEWELYQRIGEALQGQQAELSSDFNERLSARLASEAPHLARRQLPDVRHLKRHLSLNLSLSPSPKVLYAMAAIFILALILIPEFAGQEGAETSAPYFSALNANSAFQPELAALSEHVAAHAAVRSEPGMVRDAELDSYLAAHQRYSNSVYSAAEYQTRPLNPEAGK